MLIGTNDSNNKCSQQIVNELVALKYEILNKLTEVKIVFSCPTIPHDDQKSRLTILQLRNKLEQLDTNVISNDNVTG